MSDEVKVVLIVTLGIVITLNSIIWSLVYYNKSILRSAFENGYQEQVYKSEVGSYWVKK